MGGRRGAIVDIRDLSIIPRILFATDGSITHILEAYAREPIDLVRLASSMDADPDERRDLGIDDDERVLRRRSLLQGRNSGRTFVHADSVVAVDRLPRAVVDDLLETGTSLLKLLSRHRVGSFRETIAEWEDADERIAGYFGDDPAESQVARTYQIVVGGRPVAWVTETFPRNSFGGPPQRFGPDDPPGSATTDRPSQPVAAEGLSIGTGRNGSPSTPPPVVIVTGGARGIGRSVALELAAAGHPVCVNDTGVGVDGGHPDPEPACSVVEEIRRNGGRAWATAVDARTPAGARRVVSGAEAWSGRCPTVLVHAAGTLRDAMVHKATDDDWAEVLGSHLSVAVELTRVMAGPIRAQRWGRIVYFGGAAGLVGSVGQAPYDVAKAGLFGLTRAVALEMAGRDVCVNYVAPFACTRMTTSIPPVNDRLRDYLRTAGQATPDDVAPLVAWLCSAEAAGISGQVFGGRGAEIAIWSHPRPSASLVQEEGWDAPTLTARARPGFARHLTPLESEFDLFGGPPVPVAGRRPA